MKAQSMAGILWPSVVLYTMTKVPREGMRPAGNCKGGHGAYCRRGKLTQRNP
jgi:hypothetical protein